ncbi:DUF4357 domain-containing protein [Saccharothrix isguenensis]
MEGTRLVNSPTPESRRESIRDLLDAELIRAGDRLRLTRPRAGEEHVAAVSREGRIVLTSGAEYDTPSDAAKAVTGTQINGWIVWRTDANRTLASLRTSCAWYGRVTHPDGPVGAGTAVSCPTATERKPERPRSGRPAGALAIRRGAPDPS